jgi:hypothetical protein
MRILKRDTNLDTEPKKNALRRERGFPRGSKLRGGNASIVITFLWEGFDIDLI